MKSSIFVALSLFVMTASLPDTIRLSTNDHVVTTVSRSHYMIPFRDSSFISTDKLDHLMTLLDPKVTRKPVNAKLNDQGKIIKEKVGYKLDRPAFSKAFQTFIYTGRPTKLEIPTNYVYPKVDSELLAHIHEKRIGHYVTGFKSDNKERTQNIRLAARAINNYVVFPKETFSFNEVVGKRTKEKGYKRAPVIVKGELAEDIGGGICQVSSTLFNAVDMPGVDMVERYSHSRPVPYVPPGRDATVSWYGPDFAFLNKTHHPLLIRTHVKHGKMIIRIYTSAG